MLKLPIRGVKGEADAITSGQSGFVQVVTADFTPQDVGDFDWQLRSFLALVVTVAECGSQDIDREFAAQRKVLHHPLLLGRNESPRDVGSEASCSGGNSR